MSAKVEPEDMITADGETKPPVKAWDDGAARVTANPDPDRGLFGFKDPCSIKDQVRQCMQKQTPYSVFMYYKENSHWSWLAMHPVFENTTLAVIALNAVYIAVDTDWNKDEVLTPTNTHSLTESGVFFQFMEHSFCTYFTFEWVVRFMSFQIKRNGLKDGWFVFDSTLVFMMVMETWVLLIVMAALGGGGGGSPIGGTSILRLFRLLRLSRLMRMLRSLPELMILIKGMVTAMKSVAYVMGLLVLITYVFAIAFTQLAVGTGIGDSYHSNVSHSMYALLIHLTFLDDLSAYMDDVRFEMWYLLPLCFIFIALAALTVMNMLIGVLCEVVSAVAEKERDEIRTETLSNNMQQIINSLDDNRNNQISYKEFTNIIQKPEAITALNEVGVDPVSIVDFAELFFFEDGTPIELTFESFMEVVLDLRESNQATVKDMLNLWMKIKMSTNKDIAATKQALQSLSSRANEKIANIDTAHERMEGQVASIMQDLQRLLGKP
jgi:voltage-gated sodium channel